MGHGGVLDITGRSGVEPARVTCGKEVGNCPVLVTATAAMDKTDPPPTKTRQTKGKNVFKKG